MIKTIFGGMKHCYKANLHSHTTVSDGRLTPGEMKQRYKEQGYSVMCFSDHEIMRDHGDLDDDDFLTITGYEMSITQDGPDFQVLKCIHLCIYTPQQSEITQIQYSPKDVQWMIDRYGKEIPPIKTYGGFVEKKWGTDTINSVIAEAKEHGYLVTLNHPAWSMLDVNDYSDFDGLFGVEVVNYGCITEGHHDLDTTPLDVYLRKGKRVFATSVDDNHNCYPFGTLKCDSFGGYDVINADSLTYDSIFSALRSGNFYASTGAEIRSIAYDTEEDALVIDTAEASVVTVVTGRRKRYVFTEENGVPLTHVFAKVDRAKDGYVRVEVTDRNGKNAYSQAYFFE